MVTIVRPIIITEATLVGPQPNGSICVGPGMPTSTIANPGYRQPVAFELPFVSDSTLPEFDPKQAVRLAASPAPRALAG